MSYHEKRALLGLGTLLLVVVGYCIYAFGSGSDRNVQSDNIKFWAGAVLLFIAAGVIITIISEIVLYISEYLKVYNKNNKSQASASQIMKSIYSFDEMDRLIELKTSKISYAFAGIGFVSAMIFVLIGFSASVMINIIFLSMCAGSFIEGIAVIYYYKVGVSNE